MTDIDAKKLELTHVLVHLMKGVLYRDSHGQLWGALGALEARVRDYVAVLGLELALDDVEGYAFLTQRRPEDGEDLPRLVARRPLSYPVSLLCVLLRKRLAERDAAGGDVRAIVTRDDVRNAMQVYLRPQANEARQIDTIDAAIAKAAELGFLRRLDEPHTFEIRRIVKALVDAEWLADVDQKLEAYRRHVE